LKMSKDSLGIRKEEAKKGGAVINPLVWHKMGGRKEEAR
jgi:hypothetical protein